MYPVLILRAEIVCLIILLFLLFTSRSYKMGKDSRSFNRLMIFAIVHVAFDVITVLTVNNLDTVPVWLNTTCHLIFYMTAILFANELCFYVVNMCYPKISKTIHILMYILMGLYLVAVPFLKIDYIDVGGTFSSTGNAAYTGFALAFMYFFAALIVILINFGNLKRSVKLAFLPMLLVLFLTELIQIMVPSMLFTGGGITIVTVAFFFSLENPVHVFEQKAMTDALTGVRSRQSYDTDIEAIDEKFRKNPEKANYIFVFCDINNLKAVNGLFGHSEGDGYITLVSSVFMSEFKKADGIYRMGGDEFFVVFHNVSEEEVIRECRTVQTKCMEVDTGKGYIPSVAIGYAIVTPEYKTVRDVVRTADYMMYKNKTEIKGAKTKASGGTGTRLNLTGLTDTLFDAMCSSNDRTYPFIMNMETNVTRISPSWKEYFGMNDEFMSDFAEQWTEHIHPDDREEFSNDITDTLLGRKKYHNAEYRAMNSMHEYVMCSCHGAIYKGKNGEHDTFAGYMVNHGVEERLDAITGLSNFVVLDELVLETIRSKRSAIIVKLGINNVERLNMLYEYSGGRSIMREAAALVKQEVGDSGQVFTDKGVNITIFLPNTGRQEAVRIYDRIADHLGQGVSAMDSVIPLTISGGAVEIKADGRDDAPALRSQVLYALDESRYREQGRLYFADEAFEETQIKEVELLTEIHKDAVSGGDGFGLRYQPVIDTLTGRVIGAESLIRWTSPTYGEVEPGRFIGFLETDSCFYDLGLRIMRRAIQDATVMRKINPDFAVGVNITALQMRNRSFINEIMEILREENYPPEGLVLELTERSKELDIDFLSEAISELREKGILVAFDDMGTGYSTINLLMNISVDEIKLDRDFVCSLREKETYQIFVKALSGSVARKHTRICFEGVEDEETYEYIKQYGDSLCQGFYFAEPLELSELEEFTADNNDKIQ